MVKNVSNVRILGKEEYWEQSEKKKKKETFRAPVYSGWFEPSDVTDWG